MYDDEFELTFNLQDEDAAPVELPKAAEEAGPEAPAETREPAADEEPTISMTALLELLKNADPEVKAQLRLALLT